MRSIFLFAFILDGFQTVAGFNAATNHFSRGRALPASTYSPEELKQKFEGLKKALPHNADVVKSGGWYNLEQLSGNPKEELVNLIVGGLKEKKSKVQFAADEEKLEALVTLLYAHGKGFEADMVDGDWALVFSRQGRGSPKFQKLVGTREKAGRSMNVFDISSMTFSGDVKVLKKGLVYSKVKYSPLSQGYSKTADGKIVLRRIGCDIVDASFKFWKLPKVKLPLRKKGGYLDFIYMDKDIRVTRGNRGGLFVHFRPEFLEEQL